MGNVVGKILGAMSGRPAASSQQPAASSQADSGLPAQIALGKSFEFHYKTGRADFKLERGRDGGPLVAEFHHTDENTAVLGKVLNELVRVGVGGQLYLGISSSPDLVHDFNEVKKSFSKEISDFKTNGGSVYAFDPGFGRPC